MSDEASDVGDCVADPEDLLTRRDERPEAEALLNALKQNQDALSQLLAKCDEPDDSQARRRRRPALPRSGAHDQCR